MSNFSFLQDEWNDLWEIAYEAEQHCLTIPRHTANLCRIGLETSLHWMYENDGDLNIPYDKSLFSLLKEASFESNVPAFIREKLHMLRKAANLADHSPQKVSASDSLLCLKSLHSFLQYFARCYSEQELQLVPFNESLLPTKDKAAKTQNELEKLQAELASKVQEIERLKVLQSENEAAIQQVKRREESIRKLKERNAQRAPIPKDPNEAQTRQLYIDLMLKEAGWDLEADDVLEYPVTGMPKETNPSGEGKVDYVLWGEDGLPLAVVEAKKTLVDAQRGQRQAELYADCLENMKGQRPIIFFSNGYETHIWDDQNYPPRQVHGFYTRDELQTLVNRRKDKKDITKLPPKNKIAGRFYQKEAIQRVAEAFALQNLRHALIVMATGTGKTRLATSLVELLSRGNWIKRVLFLADRNALVRQGKNKFSEFLGDIPMVDVTKDKENKNSRIVFSTYPTMMNMIDGRDKHGSKFYSVGHFDLIIVDEAHRSVYNKYHAIFEYFDALMIGLTATPKDDIDHNTYELFKTTEGDPTFAYELNQAIADKFLVPPKALGVPIKFPRKGIKYKDLSEKEKEKYEETFRDEETDFIPEEIDKKALNQWLFNIDTIDQVLTYLMENGIKVDDGVKLGKTIIFARSHEHAKEIEKRFNTLYPEFNGKFLRIIDYHDPKAASTLSDFSESEKRPQIAVSVDMLDTGIDIPELVNLVFFKPVYSSSKFWQMIGRGTRQCPDLFGPGEDKEEFIIFDFCENFEFFEINPDGIEYSQSEPISHRIFKIKLRIAEKLQEATYQENEPLQALRKQYLDELHKLISHLNRENYSVRKQLHYVDQYSHRERWDNLDKTDVATISRELAHLPVIADNDNHARSFDLLLHDLQMAALEDTPDQNNYVKGIIFSANELAKKMNIPLIKAKKELIHQLMEGRYWDNIKIDHLEEVRSELRGLIHLIKKKKKVEPVYSDFKDNIEGDAQEFDIVKIGTKLQSYKLRVERYLRDHSNMLAIQRVRKGERLTTAELETLEQIMFDGGALGTKEEFQKEYGTNKPLTYFIREILGFDKGAAKQAFSEFLDKGNLTADQITFINNIIDCLSQNGVVDKERLFEPPFTDLHDDSALGLFPEEDATKIFSIVDRLNEGLG